MQGQEKAILDDNETEDHDPTTNVIGLSPDCRYRLHSAMYVVIFGDRLGQCVIVAVRLLPPPRRLCVSSVLVS